MSDEIMLKIVLEEVRYVRQRLDDHVDDEDNSVEAIREELTKMREEIAERRPTNRFIDGSVIVMIATIVSWFLSNIVVNKP
jgi:hypothetical protein